MGPESSSGSAKKPLKPSCRFIGTKGHENCPTIFSYAKPVVIPACRESFFRFRTSRKDSGQARMTFSDKYYIHHWFHYLLLTGQQFLHSRKKPHMGVGKKEGRHIFF